MKDFDLSTLRLFVAVCDSKSIKRVAERERIDASAITKRLAKLEDQVQTPLLKRAMQGVQPTPEGALFCEKARKLVLDAQKLADSLMNRQAKLAGSLTIASGRSTMAGVLTDDLASFMLLHQHGSVHLMVKEALSKDAVQMVRDGHASLAVLWDYTETTGLQQVDYHTDTVVAVMHKGHPLATRASISIQEMMDYDMVALDQHLHTQARLQRLDIVSSNARFVIQVENIFSGLRLAEKGVGIFGCTLKTVQRQGFQLDVAIVPLRDKWAEQRVKIVYPSNLINPVAKQLIQHLVREHNTLRPDQAEVAE